MSDCERPATAAILTLGCKLNIADSEAMARRLRAGGWSVTGKAQGADAVIVNTCSVTRTADQKSRHALRLARRLAPGATVAVTGCLLETAAPDAIAGLSADLVYKQAQQAELAQRLIELKGRPAKPHPEPGSAGLPRTRAFVSAQEGCNDVCAFCVIPRTRGRERSKPVAAVVDEALACVAEGALEVVITGTQLGAYGRDRGDAGPYELLAALLGSVPAARIRMSSLQPQDITPQLVSLWRDPRLCRHFHLALQSGSEGVLRRMRRRYSKQGYAEAVERLREAVPDVAITTDVIAGFPGETEVEFEESFEFCRQMAFANMHVFPYSQREHTLSARMPGQLPENVKKERVRRLIELAAELSQTYRARFLGKRVEVLWESTDDDGRWQGLTDTYVRVRAASEVDLHNRLTDCVVAALEADGVAGLAIVEAVSPRQEGGALSMAGRREVRFASAET